MSQDEAQLNATESQQQQNQTRVIYFRQESQGHLDWRDINPRDQGKGWSNQSGKGITLKAEKAI